MDTQGSVVTLLSARFDAEVRREDKHAEAPAGARLWIAGTDSDFPTPGALHRYRKHCYWLGVWDSAQDAARFLAAPQPHLPVIANARDVRSLSLLPYAHRGTLIIGNDAYAAPFATHDRAPAADEAIVIITSIGHYASPVQATVAYSHAESARNSLRDTDGLLDAILMVADNPLANDLLTISIWRDEAAAQAWAYHSNAHRQAIQFQTTGIEKPRISFTRLLIAERVGRWEALGA